jgi:RNA polymerase sigma factor (sigma-70 family)
MHGGSSRDVFRHLSTLFQCGTTSQLSDAELLETFVASPGETAEAAFAALVERHGKMVMGVCRRVLGNHDAAEDAFQATFLVLARKAGSIARREQLANWLYGVALRAAAEARGRAMRQKARERRYSAMVTVETPDSSVLSEIRSVLDEELARLPERYRTAIVLCELEGLSRRHAARKLGICEGTLSTWLARGKIQLRDRLTRRGLTLSALVLGAVLTQDAAAVVVRPALVESTIQLATQLSSGFSLAGIVSTPVATLTEGVLKAMLFAKLKSVFLGVTTVALLTTGVGVLAQQSSPGQSAEDRLRAVERKLDRLLEVLGGPGRHAATPADPTPASAAVPAAPDAPIAGTSSAPGTPAPAAAALPASAGGPASATATPAGASEPPVRVGAAAPLAAIASESAPPGGAAAGVRQTEPPRPVAAAPPPSAQPRFGTGGARVSGERQSLVNRVQALEQRLAEFERRIAAIERRLDQKPTGGAASGATSPLATRFGCRAPRNQ